MAKDGKWTISLKDFNSGYAPLSFTDPLTEIGGGGHASVMSNSDVLDGKLTQGPGLDTLVNGDETGEVDELINFIMDKAVATDTTYGISNTKLFQISSTEVINSVDPTFPRTVADMTEGSSVANMGGNVYYFYNKTTDGAIGKYDQDIIFNDTWHTTDMQKAPHPVGVKEDIICFGNGRYLGTYIGSSDTITPDKLDFGDGFQVDDVLFSGTSWYVVVNSNITGNNRSAGQIYLYDGSATENVLDDETGVGMQRIGFIYRLNGVIYVCYQDLSSEGFIIGYISGSQIKALGRFSGTMPNFQQKTLYKNTILFLSSSKVYSAGAVVDELPFQISQHANGGYSTTGAIAAPFGVPMIASSESTSFKLAKFSGYDVSSTWKSIIFTVGNGRHKGYVDDIIVMTKTLGEDARCDLTIETDQASGTSSVQSITTTGKRKHIFKNLGLNGIEDFRIALNHSNGSTTNNTVIRSVTIRGHYVSD